MSYPPCQVIRDYMDFGFVLVREAISRQSLESMRRYADDIETMIQQPEPIEVYHEPSALDGRSLVRQIENFCDFHPPFRELAEYALKNWADLVLGSESVLFKDKLNYKHPGGDGYPAHRDGRFWWRHPVTGEHCPGWDFYATEFVSLALFLDDADTESGCLEVVRGKHTDEAMGPEYGPLDEEEAREMDFEPMVARAGDLLIFNACAPHRSGPNRARHSRRVVYFTYNRHDEGDHRQAYFADKRASLAAQGGAAANR